ncbi:PadR family transcriptional regulator [Lacticaseibacillus pabuli]|uniref:PadR family transcriptional regulator n=1 Tax=Lacticaseibacillus pabuli TaxID=3025672 RepID=A0ABY7WRS5_9LACO|nr:PadR family transcriptional regulator [Lacticaseibacillus sp. KACC 23028]WDF82889.1 PadR family transcriptional regulator [Lacticaseibacillus sp. KACC 23028]
MYDLLILGALMVHDRTGYKLRLILEGNLEPRRKISNGVIYPLLHKLSEAGYITLRNIVVGGRDQKLAHITNAGKTYFDQLMHTPIAMDAKRESTFRFKFRAMGRETVGFQRNALMAYHTAVSADINVYEEVIAHLRSVANNPERVPDSGWSLRTLQLQLAVSRTKLDWTDQQLRELAGRADSEQFIALPDEFEQ